jgi:hypothetical protein
LLPGQVEGAFDPTLIRRPGPGPAKGKAQAPKPKGKPGRPKGSRDAPDSPRQQAARENQIRAENAERDRDLLKKAEQDPSLREWTDLPPEAMAPVYDLASSTIRMSGLPGLAKDQAIKDEWCKAAANVVNYYKIDIFNHPLVHFGIASFIAATPSIQAYRSLQRLEKALKANGKDSPEVKVLLEECKRHGVEIPNA